MSSASSERTLVAGDGSRAGCRRIPRHPPQYQWRHHGLGPRGRRVGRYLRHEEREVRDWFASLDDGAITRLQLPDGSCSARTYVRDLDGERRMVSRRGKSGTAAERALKAD